MEPSYLALHRTGELARRARQAEQAVRACRLCPHECAVDRTRGERGFCRSGHLARVASAFPHFGEETPLVGGGGSGTLFFSGCNLRCVYCQNAEISWGLRGSELSADRIADRMLLLQQHGCGNINLVTPSHVVHAVLAAVSIACGRGLSLPLVYNTGGYDSLSTLHLLDGVIDIYMPDAKYSGAAEARKYSGVEDYPRVLFEALTEMHRQVGDLRMDGQGRAVRGLLVRHLVLPNGIAGSERIFRFLADNISPDTFINVMDQYHPAHRADGFPELSGRPGAREYRDALRMARDAGLHRFA